MTDDDLVEPQPANPVPVGWTTSDEENWECVNNLHFNYNPIQKKKMKLGKFAKRFAIRRRRATLLKLTVCNNSLTIHHAHITTEVR